MPLKDQLKNYARKLMEDRPSPPGLQAIVRVRKPLTQRFADDGIVPNNPRFALLVYRRVLSANAKSFDLGGALDALFENNGWGRSWRDTIYDFVHYHSQVHEVLGVARGAAEVEFGGVKGRVLWFRAGDVAIVPAGTGHRLIKASRDFLVVGAYPQEGAYDECTDTRDRSEAIKRIGKVRRPSKDPVYGAARPMARLWRGRIPGKGAL